ncbi:Uncharacterized protein K02A2.6 [Araneus ventricosus]|uniref:RNA-directed DNA polymerase n=1 Tax=Araneus ventricosus TaxID=182803 RepID=A0A4Y2SS02_ARAVE|nr:Uncharacterized protein K02A2.6 [Araneus ventricosus]
MSLRSLQVCGIKDETLQRRLLTESTLTFNEAFSRAVAAQSAAEKAKHIHSQKFNFGNSIKLIRQHSNKNKRSFQKFSSSQSETKNAQSADVICYGCGGHHDRSSSTEEQLCNHLRLVLERLSESGIRANVYSKQKLCPEKKIQNADALSRLPTPETDISSPPEVLFLEELHNPPVKADEISQANLSDTMLSQVINWVLKGWTESAKECRIFYHKRYELSVHKNCLLWGNRVVILEALRGRVLDEFLISHPGIEKMKSLARCYVWWPKIEDDIENHVGLCEPCQHTRHTPPRTPVHPLEVTTKPWSRVHTDFAGPFRGQMFFLLVDSFSKWLEVKRLSSATSSATIRVIREIFATLGIPDSVASDNGSQYTTEEFRNFFSKNVIRHILVAPCHPSSNGQAERVVQTTEDALNTIIPGGLDQRLTSFLLPNIITPSSATGFIPTELLLKRRLRTVLDLLHPNLVEDRKRKK